MKNVSIPPFLLFIISAFTFFALFASLKNFDVTKKEVFWLMRIVVALAASGVSVAIPGMIKLSHNSDGEIITTEKDQPFYSLTEKEPAIVASGSVAIFVLVYLFNPLNSL